MPEFYRVSYTANDEQHTWVAEEPWPADELVDGKWPVTSTPTTLAEVPAADLIRMMQERFESENYHSMYRLPEVLLEIAVEVGGAAMGDRFMQRLYDRKGEVF